MAGFSHDGTTNETLVYADNCDFTGNVVKRSQITADGQLLIGSSVAPSIRAATISSSNGTITITNGHGSIDLSGGIKWQVISLNQPAVKWNGYFVDNGAPVTITLPAVSAVGDTIEIANIAIAAGTVIAQNAGQSIQIGSSVTTTGVGGSLTSSAVGDTIRLVCFVANTNWISISNNGNWTII